MSECEICCKPYNKSKNAKITCVKCQFDACKQCIRTYLMGTIKNAHCMACKEEWERDFLVDNLNSSFVTKQYKNHRGDILLDREKARLPETMPIVERRVKAQDLQIKNKELNDQINKLREQQRELELQWRSNENSIRIILRGGNAPEEKKQHFHRACPAENCKGFLSTAHKCGLCKIWACPKCFEIIGYNKNDPHTCIEENLKTAEMLRKETKNCPGCAATIYKISGCDQMFCTQCKIAFSWKTGEIENGVIHNPHFYEWQRQAGQAIRNPQEIPCGGIPDYWTFANRLRNAQRNGRVVKGNQDWAMKFHREANHWQHWEIRRLRIDCRDLENNLEFRVGFMMNKISEHELKSSLLKREKSRNKKLRLLHIYELMNTVFTESLIDVYNQTNDEVIENNKTRINQLINYANSEMAKVSYIYAQTVKLFDSNFNLVSRKFNKKTYNSYISEKQETTA